MFAYFIKTNKKMALFSSLKLDGLPNRPLDKIAEFLTGSEQAHLASTNDAEVPLPLRAFTREMEVYNDH